MLVLSILALLVAGASCTAGAISPRFFLPPSARPSPGGRVLHGAAATLSSYSFKSNAHPITISYSILWPPSAGLCHLDPSKCSDFPVLLWLHGASGGERSLRPLSERFSHAMRTGLIPKMIIVFPESKPLSMWTDSRDGSYPIESVLMEEFLPMIRNTLHHNSSPFAIGGFSMGGYGAARLAFKYPQAFHRLLMFGAGTLDPDLNNTPRADPAIRNRVFASVFGNSRHFFYSQSPRSLAQRYQLSNSKSPISIAIFAGSQDEVLGQNERFSAYLTGLGIKHSFHLLEGVSHSLREYISFSEQFSFGLYP